MECEDGAGDGDSDVLCEDGRPHHGVPGPDIHQPAQAVAQHQQGQTAHQAVDCHQLQTVAGIQTRSVTGRASGETNIARYSHKAWDLGERKDLYFLSKYTSNATSVLHYYSCSPIISDLPSRWSMKSPPMNCQVRSAQAARARER